MAALFAIAVLAIVVGLAMYPIKCRGTEDR